MQAAGNRAAEACLRAVAQMLAEGAKGAEREVPKPAELAPAADGRPGKQLMRSWPDAAARVEQRQRLLLLLARVQREFLKDHKVAAGTYGRVMALAPGAGEPMENLQAAYAEPVKQTLGAGKWD